MRPTVCAREKGDMMERMYVGIGAIILVCILAFLVMHLPFGGEGDD